MESFNKNTIITTIVSIIAIFAFLFLVYSATNKPETSTAVVHKDSAAAITGDHVKWSKDKKHILVEYGDYQCPACKTYHTILKTQVEATSSGMPEVTKNITFVYRHYPLTSIHKHAMEAAQTAEAAGMQNKFFEMSDKLYDTQEKWEGLSTASEFFLGLAKELKLDEKKFLADMKSQAVKDKIQKDMAAATSSDVQGTPTFYLDGKKMDNVSSFEQFKQILADTAKSASEPAKSK